MSSLIGNKEAFFSIHQLSEPEAPGIDPADGLIEIFLVISGEVVIGGNAFRVVLGSNNLYCRDRCKGGVVSIKNATEGYVIRFNKALLYSSDGAFYCTWMPAFQTLFLAGRVIQIEEPFLKEGRRVCEMMLQEFGNQHDFKLQMLCAFLNIFLFHLMRKLDGVGYNSCKAASYSILHRFTLLLEQHFKTNKKVSEYAALLYVSPNHLNGAIKQATGRSVGTLIRQRVVWEAVRQARQTSISMKEVAYDLGFSDLAHFSKFFKKEAGESFTEVRKYILNKAIISFRQGMF